MIEALVHMHAGLTCPLCTRDLTASTSLGEGDEPPVENDISMCAFCGAILQFRNEHAGLSLFALTDNEIEKLPLELRKQLTTARQLLAGRHRG